VSDRWWVCGACADRTETEPCAACGRDTLLAGRYRLRSILGRGALGTTYRGTRVADGSEVAIKELAVGRARELKDLEPFARESGVLRALDHPGVPRYVDGFSHGVGRTSGLYLVQELIEGRSLADEAASRRFEPDETLQVVGEILVILEYLHGRSPPVIHRDIKPANILRRAENGRLALIDFGSVRHSLTAAELSGSTIAGTYGYMAPEQFHGTALPSSDLYALGMVALVLVSGRAPLELVDEHHSLDWRAHAGPHPALRSMLRRLLATDPSMRFASASEARAALESRREPVVTPELHAPSTLAIGQGLDHSGDETGILGMAGGCLVTLVALGFAVGAASTGLMIIGTNLVGGLLLLGPGVLFGLVGLVGLDRLVVGLTGGRGVFGTHLAWLAGGRRPRLERSDEPPEGGPRPPNEGD
jgi:serine/threonine protein kinase